jgi:endonuclease G, mitochondrial
MSTLAEKLATLRRFNASVHETDAQLAEESADLGRVEVLEALPSPETVEKAIELESIALRRTRPVLAIRDNQTVLEFIDASDSEIWKARLTQARPLLDAAIRAVGRIDLTGAPLDWVGTGWLVAENVLVTNRHVANEFAARKGAGFAFRIGTNGPMSSSVDFLQEIDSPATLVFALVRPLHIEDAPGPDVSFFEVELSAGNPKLAAPIQLATQVMETENVATIGYPAYDSRIPEPELMEQIFGRIFNKKRLAPGGITRVEATRFLHNCTTLGGNSGSVVVDLNSGNALGLHFSGSFLETNYAVRADVVKKLLSDVRTGRRPRTSPTARTRQSAMMTRTGVLSERLRPQDGFGTATVTIPLTVTVSLGRVRGFGHSQQPVPIPPADEPDDGGNIAEEAVAADYRNRKGYADEFLGKKFQVPLPSVERGADDVLEFELDGESETALRYEHFSVVMSRSRRMCIFSAVNIDGNLSRKNTRAAWKWDPRVPKEQQIMNECYGNPPKFSRGHMTRREDPGWGDPQTAKRGNEDSMHVTNTTPQMQAFNSPIWLALEDYALGHAKEDEMRISVFTGPYFTENDPVRYGVRIPLAFWKIIAFIHDETGELCATGYEMTQEQSLPRTADEFVFGPFTSPQLGIAAQVPIRSIERRSRLSFGTLASVDPLADGDEGIADGESRLPLAVFEQIRFVR